MGADALTFMKNMGAAADTLLDVVAFVSFFMGVVLTFRALHIFAAYASNPHGRDTLNGGLMSLIVAAVLLALPWSMGTSTGTVLGGAQTYSITSYVAMSRFSGADEQYKLVIEACLKVVVLLGWIAFIRGFLILRDVGAGVQGQHSYSHGVIFIVSGTLCANIGTTMGLVEGTFFA
jgi:hypothetical protein